MTERERRILVVEDEAAVRIPLVHALEDEGYRVLEAADGEAGLQLALREDPDLVLLDLMLPGLDGFQVLKRMRQDRLAVPVIVLSARGEEWDRVQGFEYGADEYIVKPFSMRELTLRIRALLERVGGGVPGLAAGAPQERFGDVVVDFAGYTLERAGERHGLARLELELLRYLLRHEGEVVSRERLLSEVWGHQASPTTRTIDTHVLKLRRKLEPDPDAPRHLLTVRGVGYKFVR